MNQTPYQPPSSSLSDPQKPGTPLRAIITGTLFDLGATILMSMVFFIGYSIMLSSQGMPEQQVLDTISNFDSISGWGLLLNGLGLLISVWAGYVCARIVQQNVIKTVLIMAAVIAVSGTILSGNESTTTYVVLSTIATIIANMAGGVIYLNKKSRN
ncbi:hypothetical protein [Pelagibaculum spongiae]|uniref:Uncharacterized protein n=1 Tax=Pelagibaculum spongiae TaxID=2080658 RepID=A0A2V1GZ25_9GAMM|nr:hypothetical protein [Pelagibaculum spongiae]PVZ70224.1 hypothetical protein DC094_06375 [Pelagibaculum spongiae]